MKKIYLVILFLTLGLSACSTLQKRVAVSKDTIIKDVNYLASDQMKGRANFSPEIEQAADYIAMRFKQAGLVPMAGQADYKQPFTLYTVKSSEVQITIDGQPFDSANAVALAVTETVNWESLDGVTVSTVGEQEDMRKVISAANINGGKQLVLIHPAQEKFFRRYQSYFKGGVRKASLTGGGALVMLLTDQHAISSINVNASNEISGQTLHNVIGVLPGKTKAEEQIMFSAHYDHLGVKGEHIYNGADDNASGTSAVLSLADYYSALNNNERSLVFVGFAAEELGKLGSENLATIIEPDNIIAMINIEMIGKPSAFGPGRMWVTGADRSNLMQLLNDNLKPEQHFTADPYPKFQLFYRSDNASLAKLGVPAHSFSTTQLDKDKHYHKHTDDIDTLDMESLYQSVSFLAKATEPLVTGKVTPSRVEKAAVRPKGTFY